MSGRRYARIGRFPSSRRDDVYAWSGSRAIRLSSSASAAPYAVALGNIASPGSPSAMAQRRQDGGRHDFLL
jgi:hypothetical protein